MSWLYTRPTEGTIDFLEKKFAKRPEIAEANMRAFKAGYAFGETAEGFATQYEVAPAKLPPGTYRNITGNQALALGLVAASVQSKLPLFLSAYPITPASDILHDLARHKNFGVRTFQAEDEIAAVGAALGASFGGALGVCTSSGPGVILKQETIGLAVTLELPLLILDIQRAGPSTGMPTKPEQADLLAVMFGRNAEAPVPVVAASTPGGCFDAAIEAVRIALKYRTPVFLLSDAYLANGSEPWLLPDVDSLPDISIEFATRAERRRRFHALPARPGDARPPVGDPRHAGPRAPDRRAREGGRDGQRLLRPRQPRPHGSPARAEGGGDRGGHPRARGGRPRRRSLLVLGWGGTYGPIQSAARRLRKDGKKVAHAHLTHLNPFPRNLGDVLGRYDRVLVPEMNLGQLLKLVRAEFLVDAVGYNRVRGCRSGPTSSPRRSRRCSDVPAGLDRFLETIARQLPRAGRHGARHEAARGLHRARGG